MAWSRPLAVSVLAGALLLGAGAAGAADDPGVIRVEMLVGEDAVVSGGPVREFLCDDGGLVKLEFLPNGVAMRGLRAGSTLCSFRDAASVRNVVRVVVRDPPPASGATPSRSDAGR